MDSSMYDKWPEAYFLKTMKLWVGRRVVNLLGRH